MVDGLYAWWRADDAGSSDGDAVSSWSDRSGNGYTLSQGTGAKQPTYKTNILDGEPVVRFDGGDYLQASTASDWTFLHNGSDWRIFIVWKVRLLNTETANTLLATHRLSSAQIGTMILHDDRSVFGFSELHRLFIARGVSGNAVMDDKSLDWAALGGRWHIHDAVVSSDEATSRVDGRLGDHINHKNLSGYSASSPNDPLTVGASPADAHHLDGDIAEIVIYDTAAHTPAVQRGIRGYLRGRYPSVEYLLPSDTHHTLVNNSNHNAFGGLAIADDNTFVAAYRSGSDHDSGDGETVVQTSTNQASTWSGETTVNSDASFDYREAALLTLANGNILMSYGMRDSDTSDLAQGAAFKISADEGATWGSEILPSAVFDTLTRGGMQAVQLANGDIVTTVHGHDSGDTLRSVKMLRSTDNGSTWSVLSTVADGPGDSLDYSETGLGLLSSGDIVAMIREETSKDWYEATSTDSGSTWSSPALRINSALARPCIVVTDTDTMISVQRNIGTAAELSSWVSSVDAGVSWQEGAPVERNFQGPDRYVYGQGALDYAGRLWQLYFREVSDTNSDGFVSPPETTGIGVGEVRLGEFVPKL